MAPVFCSSSWNPALQSPWGPPALNTLFRGHFAASRSLSQGELPVQTLPHLCWPGKAFPSALKRKYYGEAELWAVLQGSAGNPCSIPGWELTPELGRLHTNHFSGELRAWTNEIKQCRSEELSYLRNVTTWVLPSVHCKEHSHLSLCVSAFSDTSRSRCAEDAHQGTRGML